MSRIVHIARRELTEQRRQPVMLMVITALYLLLAVVVLTPMPLLQSIANDPTLLEQMGDLLGGVVSGEDFIDNATYGVLLSFNFLMFTQFLGIAAVMSGHAVLHDRQCGTLPFLLLSPVKRVELFTGKVLGAIGTSLLLYLVVSGGIGLSLLAFPIAHAYPDFLPLNPAWWVAFLVGGPIWAVFISTMCTIVSSLASDVRTSQQSVWFIMFFGQFLAGTLLTNSLPDGVGMQVAVALLGLFCAGAALFVGSLTFRRDLGR